MRLIGTLPTDQSSSKAQEFSHFLKLQGIENEITPLSVENTAMVYQIWIRDEDQVEEAQRYLEEYQRHPDEPRFKINRHNRAKVVLSELEGEVEERPKRTYALSPVPYKPISTLILFACILLFAASLFQRSGKQNEMAGVPILPTFSPVERTLIYDYPKLLSLRDDLVKIYPTSASKEPLDTEARTLIKRIQQTPLWMGVEPKLVNSLRQWLHKKVSDISSIQGRLFEKIREGQVWRTITPIFLHLNLIHIFFNLIWFIILANQVEWRLGPWRYIFLIVAIALLSNLAQYLMSGPFFMGLSGVIVGLAGFVFARQQVAPWEGYLLNRVTLLFLFIFVAGIFLIQSLFFSLQIFDIAHGSLGIANTAHIVGGVIGYLLGRTPLFALRVKK